MERGSEMRQRKAITISTAAFLLVAILIGALTAPYFRDAERETLVAVRSARM
jgi:hypothetical protein